MTEVTLDDGAWNFAQVVSVCFAPTETAAILFPCFAAAGIRPVSLRTRVFRLVRHIENIAFRGKGVLGFRADSVGFGYLLSHSGKPQAGAYACRSGQRQ